MTVPPHRVHPSRRLGGLGRASRPPHEAPEDIDARLRRLELMISRRLEGMLHGDHLGLLPGHGSERAESREYRLGDDVRRMDWAVTARTSVPHVSDLIADRELTTYAVVDLTPSMHFGTHTWEKRDLALAATTAFGVLTTRLGSRFGLTVVQGTGPRGGVTELPPRAGRDSLRHALRVLAAAPRPLEGSRSPEESATKPLNTALEQLGRRGMRRGLVVVVSDLLGAPDTWSRSMRALTGRHQVLVVEIRDPREMTLPSVGVLALTDPETGAQLEVDTRSPGLRERFADAANAQRAEVALALRKARAGHLVLSTDSNWLLDVARHVAAARRSRGVAR
ncbi:MAG TPA: DUF58 domain-containing protein [Frankiaceae bacterium]|nr:DUF58 domain-containing protein [Frankiaceae bacterium]